VHHCQPPRAGAYGPLCYVRAGAVGTPDGQFVDHAYPNLKAPGQPQLTEIWVAAACTSPRGARVDVHVAAADGLPAICRHRNCARSAQSCSQPDDPLGDIDATISHRRQYITSPILTCGSNSYHVLVMNASLRCDLATVLDGFVITGATGFPE